jgi:hypothetical protein
MKFTEMTEAVHWLNAQKRKVIRWEVFDRRPDGNIEVIAQLEA